MSMEKDQQLDMVTEPNRIHQPRVDPLEPCKIPNARRILARIDSGLILPLTDVFR